MTRVLDNPSPESEAYFAQPRGKLSLWTGVLGGPVAWAVQFQGGYALVRFSCTRQWTTALHHGVTVVMLAAAVASALLALREWRRVAGRASDEAGVAGRSHFLAGLGVVTSGLFALLIVAEWVPMFFLSPCWY